jgi:cytochrome c-type biogenesis protein CcmH/NrfF
MVQQTVYASLHAAGNALLAPAAARLFARHGLPHRLADSKEMAAFLLAVRRSTCPPPKRAAIKEAQTQLAADLREEVIARLTAGSVTYPISIAIDGWTNTRHEKVTNLLCLCGGQAYYWCSIV